MARRSARALGRQIATRSTVLLANPKGVLPLRRDLARVAVIGPNARSIRNLFGGYSAANVIEMLTNGDMGLPAPVLDGESVLPHRAPPRTIAEQAESEGTGKDFGFVRRIATRPSETSLAAIDAVYADTPTVLAAIESIVADGTEVVFALGCHVNDPSTEGIPEAVDAATGSDVAIVVLGDKTGLVGDAVVGETRDRSTVELAGAQRTLFDAVAATGVPVVVVLLGSQPVPVLAEEGGPAAVVQAGPAGIGGRGGDRRRSLRHREPVGQDPDHDPTDGRSMPDLPRTPPRQRAEHLYRPRGQRTGLPLRPRAELHDLRVPVAHAWTGPRSRLTERSQVQRPGGELGRPFRRGGGAALCATATPRRHPSRA